MVRRYTFCVLLVFIAVCTVAAQTPGCEVPDGMTKEQKLPCVRAGRMLLDQPTLSPTQLANGPGFDSAEPEKSRFAYSTADDTIVCYFRPHYAFAKVPGDSMKFQCWHMTADGAFYNRKGETVRVDDVKVVIEKDKSGEKSASLYARTDDKNEHEIKADHFKIKYLKPPYPDHNRVSMRSLPRSLPRELCGRWAFRRTMCTQPDQSTALAAQTILSDRS